MTEHKITSAKSATSVLAATKSAAILDTYTMEIIRRFWIARALLESARTGDLFNRTLTPEAIAVSVFPAPLLQNILTRILLESVQNPSRELMLELIYAEYSSCPKAEAIQKFQKRYKTLAYHVQSFWPAVEDFCIAYNNCKTNIREITSEESSNSNGNLDRVSALNRVSYGNTGESHMFS